MDWFSKKRDKFLNNIDTLYYTVYTDVFDWSEDFRSKKLITYLKDCKELSITNNKPVEVFTHFNQKNINTYGRMGFSLYSLHFGIDNMFDCFVCTNPPNKKTPPIIIQLRSNSLWLDGVSQTFNKSFSYIQTILMLYGINIIKTQENRIDYCYHTNIFNDINKVFKTNKLNEMQVSHYERWSMQGTLNNNQTQTDYVTFGRRASNNTFIRIYNKTQEVIEQGYKQYFVPLWYKNGLISLYDEYVLKETFISANYQNIHKSRLLWLINKGIDFKTKINIDKNILSKNLDNLTSFQCKRIADKLGLPPVTIITNVEIQCKRKFFDTMPLPDIINSDSPKSRILNVLEQSNNICNFITHNCIRFVAYTGKFKDVKKVDRPYAYWWNRLRMARIVAYSDDWVIDYCRVYQHNLDIRRAQNKLACSLATAGAYHNIINKCDSKFSDCVNFQWDKTLDYLNDNDIIKYKNKYTEVRKKIDLLISDKDLQDGIILICPAE